MINRLIGCLLALIFLPISALFAQVYEGKKLVPTSAFDNIHVQELHSDTNSSSYAIWVKNEVRLHKHQHHTEVVVVVQGKGTMSLGDKKQKIKKGDVVVILPGTPHAVVTTSKKPLIVISIQSPKFEGSDRIWLE